MRIETENFKNAVVAKLDAPTLETENVGAFRSAIAPILERADKVVLDLSSVSFMDSTGLGAMLSCLRSMKAKGGSMSVANLTPEVRRLFDLVMMDRVFEIHADVDSAVASK
ncbi:MAG TPA: STAS domain-containing protein [Fimbriimonas sp.]|nr:STAS domain-containing protein [Fimbriimonas sp.]